MELEFTKEALNLFLDFSNTRKLKTLLNNIPENVKNISAAVAYTTPTVNNKANKSLVQTCIDKKISLEWWGLFNAEGATAISEIIKALKNPELIKFYPFAKNFHSKVIWFHNYGIYIGSHNFTLNAMENNVEAGVFVREEFFTEKQKKDINDFFTYLNKHSIAAVPEDIEKLEQFIDLTSIERKEKAAIKQKLDNYFEDQFSNMFRLPNGVQDNTASNRNEKKKETLIKSKEVFEKEWRSTQNCIRQISEWIFENCKQPHWVNKEAPLSIITDQIMHAYFYSYVLKGSEDKKSGIVIEKEFQKNKGNSKEAVLNAIRWWENLEKAPSSEDKMINEWSITNKKLLSEIKNRKLTKDELYVVLTQNHAARTHARQMKNSTYNLSPNYSTDENGRFKLYVDWLFKQKSKDGLDINDLIKYLLYGTDTIETRIFNCFKDEHYMIDHVKKSVLGELVGWGLPETNYIRNNRVNKALRCLGYDIELFSE